MRMTTSRMFRLAAAICLAQACVTAYAAGSDRENRWSATLMHTPRPGKGCFEATYPEIQWSRVACGKAPAVPLSPRRGGATTTGGGTAGGGTAGGVTGGGLRGGVSGNSGATGNGDAGAATVGGGIDFSADVPGLAAEAVGSFDAVSGVTSEVGGGTANAYTLQLNTQFFPTVTCSSGASGCVGWEQFVFLNDAPPSVGLLFIQYWLLGYGTCPSGWMSADGYCYRNSATALEIPGQTIGTLGSIQLAGAAGTATSDDTAFLVIGNVLYSLTGGNYFPDLGQRWQISEFNIFGPGNGSQAVFNSGASLTVRTQVDSGASNAPGCSEEGYTAETNNLSLVSAPQSSSPSAAPAIVFTESNASSTTASCEKLYAIISSDAPAPWWSTGALGACLLVSACLVLARPQAA
jgi:hypothetical protein